MAAVSALVKAGGNDGMANAPNVGLSGLVRSKSLIAPARCWRSSKRAMRRRKDYLSLTLEAGAKLDLRDLYGTRDCLCPR